MRTAGRTPALLLAFLALLAGPGLAGCSLVPGSGDAQRAGVDDVGIPFPTGCGEFGLSARRCQAIVERIAASHGVDPAQASEIRLLGDPGCFDDPKAVCNRTVSFVVRVRLVFPGRAPVEDSQFCGIEAQYTLLCTDAPEVRLSAPTIGGYHDIPCAGEPPDGCASPVPTIEPAAARAGVPLEVASLEIPLDHDGLYEVPLGTAVLPNGVLSESSFALVDPHQVGFTLADGVISLVVTGPDGPMWNAYEAGWRPGTVSVSARLVFTIEDHEPGMVIHVRDVVVR